MKGCWAVCPSPQESANAFCGFRVAVWTTERMAGLPGCFTANVGGVFSS